MFYRVVMQGRTLGGADVDDVKRHFVRVTGLPVGLVEDLFGGMPQVIKRQVPQTDAERIAATLRAIGAAATVERELPGTEDETEEGIQVVAHPLNIGPPTVIPGAVMPTVSNPAPSRLTRVLQAVLARWQMIVGGVGLVAGAILAAPIVDDFLANMRPTPPPAKASPARAPSPDVIQSSLVFNATLVQGPWRCTDQRTGVATYWSYGAEGALIFHGDALKDGPAPNDAAAPAPTGWKIDAQRLIHTFQERGPHTYMMSELTLSRLRYGDDRRVDIQCRRP